MKIGNYSLSDGNTHVMGIINVTPDSFSDGGRFVTMDKVIERADQMVQQGAAIIDVGGESTRPGYTMISDEEEISRVVPAIEAIKARLDVPISIDTYKSRVAEAAICAGADMINDIWGLQYDVNMVNMIKRYDASVTITHNRKSSEYNNYKEDIVNELKALCDYAESQGVAKEKIIIDPGFGFAKSIEQNLIAMNMLAEFKKLGYPVLIGTSRKSFIGNTLSLPVDERLEGTLATTALAVVSGMNFVRVHDVKENVRMIKMLESIRDAK